MISFYVRTSFRISDLNNVARERERVATHECGETGGCGEDGRGEQKKETEPTAILKPNSNNSIANCRSTLRFVVER